MVYRHSGANVNGSILGFQAVDHSTLSARSYPYRRAFCFYQTLRGTNPLSLLAVMSAIARSTRRYGSTGCMMCIVIAAIGACGMTTSFPVFPGVYKELQKTPPLNKWSAERCNPNCCSRMAQNPGHDNEQIVSPSVLIRGIVP